MPAGGASSSPRSRRFGSWSGQGCQWPPRTRKPPRRLRTPRRIRLTGRKGSRPARNPWPRRSSLPAWWHRRPHRRSPCRTVAAQQGVGYKRTVHPQSEREEVDADQYQVAPCEWQPGAEGDDTIVATPQPNGVLVATTPTGAAEVETTASSVLRAPTPSTAAPGRATRPTAKRSSRSPSLSCPSFSDQGKTRAHLWSRCASPRVCGTGKSKVLVRPV